MKRHCDVRAMVAKVAPGYERLRAIDETRAEFHVVGRTLHEPRFPTASGKARFVPHAIPMLERPDDALRLMTVRSEGQFNTVVYEEEDVYRGQERRDVILMNVADVQRLGLTVDQPVTVRSAVGELGPILVRAIDVRAGNVVMYYPEANVLVPRTIDPLSKTPAFKSVLVRVEPVVTNQRPGRRALAMTST
jgi:anaerobic selenocysteine-containing dehydrogenase